MKTIIKTKMKNHISKKKVLNVIAIVLSVFLITSCASLSKWFEDLNRELKGVHATMSTYTQDGTIIDRISGDSFSFTRETTFDTKDGEGRSNKDSSVIKVSIGGDHILHVGSTLILAEDGLKDVLSQKEMKIELDNTEPGMPWLNNMVSKYRNIWQGKAKTIIIRSQDGLPIATFVGNTVEIFSSDVPKTTYFRVDGKMLLVYRADYTVYDNNLLK